MFTSLPTVAVATPADIICAVQGGVSVQETLQQVLSLNLQNTILNYPGNPNGNVAGTVYQFCWDTTDDILYICTTSGIATLAVWTVVSSESGIVPPIDGGTGVSDPTAHTLPIAQGSAAFNFLGPLNNGEVLIGSTGEDPVPATLTAGLNITITNTAGAIEIASTGAGAFDWTNVTGTSVLMEPENGYIISDSSLVTLTLPLISVIGEQIKIIGRTGGWQIAQNSGQIIHFGNDSTTLGTGGSLASTSVRDSISIICTVANTEWTVDVGPQGNISVV